MDKGILKLYLKYGKTKQDVNYTKTILAEQESLQAEQFQTLSSALNDETYRESILSEARAAGKLRPFELAILENYHLNWSADSITEELIDQFMKAAFSPEESNSDADRSKFNSYIEGRR